MPPKQQKNTASTKAAFTLVSQLVETSKRMEENLDEQSEQIQELRTELRTFERRASGDKRTIERIHPLC